MSRVLAIRLQDHPLALVAHGGTFLPAPVTLERVVLAPGNRADVVVRAGPAGRYSLVADPVERGGMGAMMGGAAATSGPATLASMLTAGAPVSGPPLPAALLTETIPAAPVTAQRQVVFQPALDR